MKTIFNNSELVHTFAQQTQQEGRTSTGGMFFYNQKIYSYGYHYLLGEFIDSNTIIINDKGYSVSTSKHISLLRNATSQYKQLFVSDIDLNFVKNVINTASKQIVNARNKEKYSSIIISKFETLESYLKEFKKVNDLKSEDFKAIKKIYKAIKQNESLYIEDAKKREQKAKAKEQIKFTEDLKKFNNYEIDYIYKKNIKEDFIRISQDGTQIQTTQGVKVSIQDAKNLYAIILEGKDIKGLRIDNYTIISLNGHLKIGCHNINVENMHQIGRLINN